VTTFWARRLVAEALGAALLLVAIVGSGILAERLAGGNVGLALLANAAATGAALFALIEMFSPLSGAHLNPAVSLVLAARGDMRWRTAAAYCIAQTVGAVAGVGLANIMFGGSVYSLATQVRFSPAAALGEAVSTFGLIGCQPAPNIDPRSACNIDPRRGCLQSPGGEARSHLAERSA
jgi:glycerol uptake facilitator-like aquaporin